MRVCFVVCLLCMILLLGVPYVVAAAPSSSFWDPFRNTSENVFTHIEGLIDSLLNTIQTSVGRTVSAFRIPDPNTVGIQDRAVYHPATSPQTTVLPRLSKTAAPAAPIRDVEHVGVACGGGDTDPFWANDCSCHCSEGGISGAQYEALPTCPEDSNRSCQDCRPITREDRTVLTVAGCRDSFSF